MTEAMDLSGTTGPAVTPATDSGGRELTPAVAMLAVAVAIVSLLVGALMAAVSLAGHAFGAWKSPEALTPGLIGAAMLGVSPGLLAIGRARVWEEVRTLVLPLAVVLVGLLGVSLGNAGNLQLAEGGSVILVRALVEDDLHRLRPALLAVPGVALAAAVVLGVHASDVDWTSGPGLSLTCMITGLLLTGATGTRLLSAGPASPRGTIEVATVEESDRG
ncbi:hypothetical protein [Streptomyces sp. H39-C1]|uniref:hypothetical protein n=1 Tax=Streptomyces sp. H39-C1 TaxID=3004355 RepID=UPI0022AE7FC9|nr:hypothetical protein [Streptomyces sp. H39-C1]MCZ4096726.1 hypothetical protein [Streptomyces sp. H39-C1]